MKIALVAPLMCLPLLGCISTSMQGYADRQLPAKPVQRIVTLINAPQPLSTSIQGSVVTEARKRGVEAQDALLIFPPTRPYTDAEIKREMQSAGVDAVLIIEVGDSGIRKEYAGTIFEANYSASTFGPNTTANMSGSATPVHRYSRQTHFQARLVETASQRTLWVGSGQVRAGGLLFVGDGANATSSVSAIFDDLESKGLIRRLNS